MRHSELIRATAIEARMDEHGQLEPVSVDESLTTVLFTSGSKRDRTAPPAADDGSDPIGPPRSTGDVQAALFEVS